MSASNELRTVRTRLEILIGLLLGALLFVLVNYVSFRHYRRFDWTSTHSFTLSGRTKEVLRRLDRTVDVYLFVPEEDELYRDLDELLRSYGAETTNLRIRRIDPGTQEGEYRILASRFGVETMQTQDGSRIANVDVVLESNGKHWTIRRDDLISADLSSSEDGPVLDVAAERALTGGILEVVSGRRTKVCVGAGHGEFALEGQGPRTLAALEESLRLDNLEFETVELRANTRVPEGCDAVVVLGPQRPFSADEATMLGGYLDGGGHLLLALDPILDPANVVQPSGLEAMLRAHGITLGRDLVIETDPAHQLGGGATELFLVDSFTSHPVVAALRSIGAGIAMHSARSVGVLDEGPAMLVAQTTPDAYAETDVAALAQGGMLVPGDGDPRGPIGLVAAFPTPSADPSAQAPQGRLVVVGDADWLRSELLDPSTPVANADFASAILGTLTSRPALVTIAPRRANARALLMPEDGPTAIAIRVVILLPLAFALLGFSIWWSRRV